MVKPLYLLWWSLLLIVDFYSDTSASWRVFFSWLDVVKGFFFTMERILRSSTTVVLRGRPGLFMFRNSPVRAFSLRMYQTVDLAAPNVPAISLMNLSVTPRVRTITPSGSRTRDSGAAGGRSTKEVEPLVSVASAPLFEVRGVRFTHSPYWHTSVTLTPPKPASRAGIPSSRPARNTNELWWYGPWRGCNIGAVTRTGVRFRGVSVMYASKGCV